MYLLGNTGALYIVLKVRRVKVDDKLTTSRSRRRRRRKYFYYFLAVGNRRESKRELEVSLTWERVCPSRHNISLHSARRDLGPIHTQTTLLRFKAKKKKTRKRYDVRVPLTIRCGSASYLSEHYPVASLKPVHMIGKTRNLQPKFGQSLSIF